MTLAEKAQALLDYLQARPDFTMLEEAADLPASPIEPALYRVIRDAHIPAADVAEARRIVEVTADLMDVDGDLLAYSM